jgi:hypothetical protein
MFKFLAAVILVLSTNATAQVKQGKTTAEIKMNGLVTYLKVEQVKSDATARVLFNCNQGVVFVAAGIVTTAELSSEKNSSLVRNYLEINQAQELLVSTDKASSAANGSTLWLFRNLSASNLIEIIQADSLGIWTEDGGDKRWGVALDLRPARKKIADFSKNCLQVNP